MDAESNEWRRKTRYTYALKRVASVWGEQKDTWHTYAPHENSIRKRVADTEWQKTIMMTAAAVQQTIINNNCILSFFRRFLCLLFSLARCSLCIHFRRPISRYFIFFSLQAACDLNLTRTFRSIFDFFWFSAVMHVTFVAQCIYTYTKFIIAHETYSTLFNLLVTS